MVKTTNEEQTTLNKALIKGYLRFGDCSLPQRAKWLAKEALLILLIALIAASGALFYPSHRARATGNTRLKTVQFPLGGYGNQGSDAAYHPAETDMTLADSSVSVKAAYIEVSFQFGAASAATYTGGNLKFGTCTTAGCSATLNTRATLGAQPANSGESQVALFRADVTADFSGYSGGGSLLRGAWGWELDRGAANTIDIEMLSAKTYITYTYDDTSANFTNSVIYPLESTAAGGRGSATAVTAPCTLGSCPTFTYSNYIPELPNASTCAPANTCRDPWFEPMGYVSAAASTANYYSNMRIGTSSSTNQCAFLEGLKAQGGGLKCYGAPLGYLTSTSSSSTQTYERDGVTHSLSINGGEAYTTYNYPSTATTRLRTVSFPVGVIQGMNGSTSEFSAAARFKLPETGAIIQKAWWRLKWTESSGGAPLIKLRHYTEGVGTGACADNTQLSVNLQTSVGVNGGGQVSQGQQFNYVIPSSDYATMAAAGVAGKDVGMCAQWAVAGGDVSAELMVTYSYTGESSGYLTSATTMGGQQTSAPAQSYTTAANAITTYAPEAVGFNKQMLAAGMDIDYEQNHSALATGAAGGNINGTTVSNIASTKTSAENEWVSWYKTLGDSISNTDATTYTGHVDGAVAALNSVFSFSLWYTYLYKPQVSTSAISPAQELAGNPVTLTTANAGLGLTDKHMLGRTSIEGVAINNGSSASLMASRFILTQAMNVSSSAGAKICAYFGSSGGASIPFKAGVYSDSSGSPGTKLVDFMQNSSITNTPQWNCVSTVNTSGTLAAGTYWLAFAVNDSQVTYQKDASIGTNSFCSVTAGAGAVNDPLPSSITCTLGVTNGTIAAYLYSNFGNRCSSTDQVTFNGVQVPCTGGPGPNNGVTFADDASIGTIAWVNPSNAQFEDGVLATASTLTATSPSHYLKATGFGFNIPSTATIKGIVVETKKSTGTTVTDNAVRIIKAGTIGTTDRSAVANWPASLAYTTYGSSTDLWGDTWTPSDINNSNFGFAISAKVPSGSAIANVDHIRITVYSSEGVESWSDGSVTVRAPSAGSNGNVCVTAYNLTSNCQAFKYLPSMDEAMRGGLFWQGGVKEDYGWAR